MLKTQHMAQLLLLLLLQLSHLSQSQIISCGMCTCDENSITCDGDDIGNSMPIRSVEKFLPSAQDISSKGLQTNRYTDLYINCKRKPHFRNQRLPADMLAAFPRLKRVSIVRCDIVSVHSRAFRGVRTLEILDLSDNEISDLPDGVFEQIPGVSTLKLGENPLQLSDSAFRGLQLRSLTMSHCQLKEFPLNSLAAMTGLKELIMSNNSISYLPKTALPLLRRLTVFFIDRNPIMCSCEQKWLRTELEWNVLTPLTARQPRCNGPFALAGAVLKDLSPSEFQCRAASINSVKLEFISKDKAHLKCQANLPDGQQQLAWHYRSTSDVKQDTKGNRISLSIQRASGRVTHDQLTLLATVAGGTTSHINVSISWPLPPPPPPPPLLLPSQPQNPTLLDSTRIVAADPNDSYFSEKQFSLTEMIVAIIATCVITTALFALSYQFTRWYKERDRKRWATYGCQPQYHQHSLVQPLSGSHEYDLPRCDEWSVPLSGGVGSVEYFDFTNASRLTHNARANVTREV